jgi:hypothetical protein
VITTGLNVGVSPRGLRQRVVEQGVLAVPASRGDAEDRVADGRARAGPAASITREYVIA